jgi:ankyrin repeat protein
MSKEHSPKRQQSPRSQSPRTIIRNSMTPERRASLPYDIRALSEYQSRSSIFDRQLIPNIISYGMELWPVEYTLKRAAETGNLELLKDLANNEDLHANNEELLRLATINGHLDIVKYLVEDEKANILDAPTNNLHHNSFINAIDHNRPDILEYFMSRGIPQVNVNHGLIAAVGAGNMDLVEYLLRAGATNLVDACYTAAFEGRIDFIEYFLTVIENTGESIDFNKMFNFAARGGNLETLVHVLHLHSMRTDQLPLDYNKALVAASEYGRLEIVKYLISLGADDIEGANYALSAIGTRRRKKERRDDYEAIGKYLTRLRMARRR